MRYILLIDFGSTFTKLTAVDLLTEDVIGTSKSITTVDSDIAIGYNDALSILQSQLNHQVIFDKVIACSSAAGGLKMAAIGLVESLTTEAAKRVCLGAGAKVESIVSHHINLDEIKKIVEKKIDIILLAGGADGGNSECVIYNAKKLAAANLKIPIVFAGNKAAYDDVYEILINSNQTFFMCENVMPKLNVLNIEDAKEKIKDIFVKNIIEAKGIKKIESSIDKVILPTPHAVLLAAELLSKGFADVKGLGELMVIDLGGATTDVYSMADGDPKHMNYVLSGLEEPFAKRTVEGDLGMRYSALGIIQSLNPSEIAAYQNKGIDLVKEASFRNQNIEFIPKDEKDLEVEDILASLCVNQAVSRHVGYIKPVYTPHGIMYQQHGKDLSQTSYIIGVGGALIHSQNSKNILEHVLKTKDKPMELRPENPVFLLDQTYILSSMGLLSTEFPKIALNIMKKHLVNI